jgi:2-phosphosulfolactate phosphatase
VHAVRFDWGPAGARAAIVPGGALVIVDVLSFSTAAAIAVGRGTAVYPCDWPAADVEALAAVHDAAVAVPRSQASPDRPWSLSPASLARGPLPRRLILPSPNGSAICAAAANSDDDEPCVLAGCLRNASAVASWLDRLGYGAPGRPVAVIAAGERWPDGELRPALEDLLGAGAIIAGLAEGAPLSPEAAAAQALWSACRDKVGDFIHGCVSGQELIAGGYSADVALAVQHDAQDTVPVLSASAFVDGTAAPKIL